MTSCAVFAANSTSALSWAETRSSEAVTERSCFFSSGSGSRTRELGSGSTRVPSPGSETTSPEAVSIFGASEPVSASPPVGPDQKRSEEHTSELQSRGHLVCRLLLEKKKKHTTRLDSHTDKQQRTGRQ